jgi:ankyrin repeat protein
MTVKEAIAAGDAAALRAATDSNGIPPIRLALYHGCPDLAAALRAMGEPVDLHTAAALGESAPGDLASYSEDGWTPLHLAAFFGHAALVEELVQRGASVHARSRNGLHNLPIHAAAAARRLQAVQALIAAGSPVNESQHGGYVPLHSAAQSGDAELVRILLAAGARTDLTSLDGQTPAGLARAKGFQDLAALLA